MKHKTIKKRAVTISSKEVYFEWECPECKQTTLWSYFDLVTRGNPVCSKDDVDMDLKEFRNKKAEN